LISILCQIPERKNLFHVEPFQLNLFYILNK
jgi:hypothetical protein